MFHITLITVGKLKERYYAAAADEYIRRLGAYCKFELIELPECRLPDDPNGTQIAAGLAREAEQIEAKLPRGAWFCVLTPEGTQLSSEELAAALAALNDAETYGAILRAKGAVASADGQWLYFDYVPEEHEIRAGHPDYTGRLCVIGSNLKEEKLAELFGL